MPLFRKERSYTFSAGLTKVFTSHDLRVGVDVVRHSLNHIQAEFGDIGGVRGGFRFNGTVTGVPGYTPLLWNEFGTFLLGLQTYQGKDVQTEEMTGREWQSAIYLRDRWNVKPQLHDQRRPAARALSADVARRPRPRAARPGHLRGADRRPRQHARRRRHQHEVVVLRAAARGDVPLRREGGGARRLRAHDQPAAVVAADARLVPAGHLLQPHRRSVRRSRHARGGHSAGAGAGHQLGPCAAPARRLHAVAEPERRRSRHHPAVERGLRVPPAVGHRRGGGLRRDGHGWRLCRPRPELRRPGRRQRLAAVLRAGRHHGRSATGRRARRAATTACSSR